ncbi:MAG: serine/threonine-protein kinase [Myxococcota bacterium]|nr:serine/threonine-protein kinase [Myxococcota bacterium]
MDSLGRYKLVEPLGEGGMAEVFRARLDGPMGFQKDVAIKRIRDSLVKTNEEHVRSLINEARIGGLLKHPNVVEVYDLGEESGSYYIAMELVDGPSLRELLGSKSSRSKRLPPNVLLDITIQICRGLAYAHTYSGEDGNRLEVVHRDLKPSNIMITRNGTVKIMDFGIAKSESNLFTTTAAGVAKGTPLYMSPEQLRGMRPLPKSSDLFSLGAILFEMITGEILFAGTTIPEIINRVLYQPLAPDIQEAEDCITGITPVLERLLQRDVAHREQEAQAVAAELEHVLEWQDRSRSTAAFIRDFRLRGDEPDEEASNEPSPTEDLGTTQPGKRQAGPETFVSQYVGAQRRRRIRLGLLLLLLLAAVVGTTAYIWRGTVDADKGLDAGTLALNSGDLAGATQHWEQVVQANPGRGDARLGLVALSSLQTLDEAAMEGLTERIALAPEITDEEAWSKLRARAGVYRAAGLYSEAILNIEAAVGRARQAVESQGGTVPPSLLWEAGELALFRRAVQSEYQPQPWQLARFYFQELAEGQPPGPVADAAAAHVASIDRDKGGLLRAEIAWREDADPTVWSRLPRLLSNKDADLHHRQRERIVWIYRALGEGHYEAAGDILGTLEPLTGERERRRQTAVAQAAVQAAAGRARESKHRLAAALKLSKEPEISATARLQVAVALIRSGKDPERTAALLEEVADPVGDDDPDLARVLQIQRGERGQLRPPDIFPGVGRLSLDLRSGRLFPTGLSRGSPSAMRLALPESYPVRNRNANGMAWPFGPAFHPLDGGVLPVLFNPAR